MSHQIIRTAALGLLLGLGAQASAESFDREQAVRHALAHNPELLAMREQVAAAGGRTQAAQGARLPSLGLSYYRPESVSIPKRFFEITTWKGKIDRAFMEELRASYDQRILDVARFHEDKDAPP